ncbi:MAG TPA: carboxylating nicotinate-nucleotide diphosphorylase [Chloroflexota bacterium]
MRPLSPRSLAQVVRLALDEDLGEGDVTTDALVRPDLPGRAIVLAKQVGVLAGVAVLAETFREVDPAVVVQPLAADGQAIAPGDTIARIRGPAASILKGERVALNLLQRMCGIASLTRRYVEAVAGTQAVIVDTRKTTPGLRALEKYAVRVGGGQNHRTNLSDGVLIKDNHIAAVRSEGHGIAEAVRRARAAAPHTVRVEVEVTSLDEVDEAVAAGPDIILLDNMAPAIMAQAVRRIHSVDAGGRGRALAEASGGIVLESVRAAAEAGVDLISVGALTHSVPALDISLELELE